METRVLFRVALGNQDPCSEGEQPYSEDGVRPARHYYIHLYSKLGQLDILFVAVGAQKPAASRSTG